MQQNKLAIPIAIVVAGVLIAGAVFYTSEPREARLTGEEQGATNTESIEMEPVTNRDHILGNPDAEIIIVEYSDTECPFCKDFHFTMHDIIDEYGRSGEVAWVYRHFPIAQLHARAPQEAEATECAAELGGNTGFWNYIDRVFEITPSNDGLSPSQLPAIAEEVGLNREAFENCLASGRHEAKVQAQFEDAQRAGGRGTPFSVIVLEERLNPTALNLIASAAGQLPPRTIVISNDQKRVALNGALPFDLMKLLIDAMLGNNLPAARNDTI